MKPSQSDPLAEVYFESPQGKKPRAQKILKIKVVLTGDS